MLVLPMRRQDKCIFHTADGPITIHIRTVGRSWTRIAFDLPDTVILEREKSDRPGETPPPLPALTYGIPPRRAATKGGRA